VKLNKKCNQRGEERKKDAMEDKVEHVNVSKELSDS
jgi:hypothetical protein